MIVRIGGRRIDLGTLTRREFLRVAGGAATAAAGAGVGAAAETAYPVVEVGGAAALGPGEAIAFTYPDESSPALLIRLEAPIEDGAGPGRDLVAYSVLCTHKGCPVAWRAEHRMLVCPCHWSTFNPAKNGTLVIGQASQGLPRVALEVEGAVVRAVGLDGLVYGRHTNVL